MPIRQKIVAMLIAAFLFFIIINLIRRRRLKEEYSWLWFLAGLVIIVLTMWYDLLVKLTQFIGAVMPTSTLFFFTFLFLILVCLQFSVSISELSDKIKNLAQELAILKSKLDKF
ncbi:MAG: hypothetical protein A3D92_24955 [Bacteroidetes bacterium RIFCSPHIGHO2_02_FULL_44_7]|nr:MAG: hypothetical protein A3D92_24955 [Bacteroidetes bacterium RIFCSPHIGHO2_02_FULL_44_7]